MAIDNKIRDGKLQHDINREAAKISALSSGRIDHYDLIYYFKNNTARKKINDSDNGIELFRKMQSGEMKLKDAKELQNIFKSNLNEISKGRFKSKEQKSALGKIKFLYESRRAVIKLFNDYSSIASETKHKAKQGKGLKILTPKQMLPRLSSSCTSKSR